MFREEGIFRMFTDEMIVVDEIDPDKQDQVLRHCLLSDFPISIQNDVLKHFHALRDKIKAVLV